MKQFCILLFLLSASISYAQYFSPELDTIIYWSEGTTDSLGKKQGIWRYNCDQYISRIQPILKPDGSNYKKIEKRTQCYAIGSYENDEKEGLWTYEQDRCHIFHGTYSIAKKTECYYENGNIKNTHSEMFWNWEYTLNADSSILEGKVFLSNWSYIPEVTIEGTSESGSLICRFVAPSGVVIDEFDFVAIDTKCQFLYYGFYDEYLLVEDFSSFSVKFYSDSSFQKSRIKKPLHGTIKLWHETKDSVITSTWQDGDLNFVSSYEMIFASKNNVLHDIKWEREKRIELIYIMNSGFLIEREFMLEDRKWYLVRYDYSYL